MAQQTVASEAGSLASSRDDGRVTADKVAYAVHRIVEWAKPLRVVAFGSRARGNHRAESDLDLAVILDDFDAATEERPVKRTDLDLSMPVDLLVVSRGRYEFMRDSIISVHRDIEQEGVVLYDAAVGSIHYRAVERVAR